MFFPFEEGAIEVGEHILEHRLHHEI